MKCKCYLQHHRALHNSSLSLPQFNPKYVNTEKVGWLYFHWRPFRFKPSISCAVWCEAMTFVWLLSKFDPKVLYSEALFFMCKVISNFVVLYQIRYIQLGVGDRVSCEVWCVEIFLLHSVFFKCFCCYMQVLTLEYFKYCCGVNVYNIQGSLQVKFNWQHLWLDVDYYQT